MRTEVSNVLHRLFLHVRPSSSKTSVSLTSAGVHQQNYSTIAPSSIFSLRTTTTTTTPEGGGSRRDDVPRQSHRCRPDRQRVMMRAMTSSSAASADRNVFLPGNVIRSPVPDIDFPSNVPFHQFIFDKCDQFKDSPALSDFLTGRSYTYSELKEKSIRVASALSDRGYRKGDIILAFSTNQIDYAVLMLASSCLGIWFCAANPAFTPKDLARQVSISDSVAIFVHPFLAPIAEEALAMEKFQHKIKDKFVFGEFSGYQPFQTLIDNGGLSLPEVDINPMEDVFVLPYSSGTTGLPKGVMLSHHNLIANTLQTGKSYEFLPEDNFLGILPLYHIYGMVVVQFGSLYHGSHLHLLPKFEPESFLTCIQERKINKANLVPPLVLFLAKHPLVTGYDLSSLRDIVCGAAPLGKEISETFVDAFDNRLTVRQGYGMTETSPVTHVDRGQNFGSIGQLVANTTAKIVDVDGGTGEGSAESVCGPGQQGELCVRGPQVMLGYYKNEQATREMVTKDGWLYTGDIGYYNEEGLFFICDRLKELIKYKGSQVAPAELEGILVSHPGVADACVLGIHDERAGELPKAFVVKEPGVTLTEDDVIDFVNGQVSDFKKLRGGVEFIQEIPKNPAGKILRRLLKKD